MVSLPNNRLNQPVKALGNIEDPRETNPDAPVTTAIALWRGLLYEMQNLTVEFSGSLAATQSGTWNIGTVSTVTAVTAITNALPAGSNAIGKLAANSGVIIGSVEIAASQTLGVSGGQAAHDASIGTTTPIRISGRAQTSMYAAVTSGDVADVVTTVQGAIVTQPYAVPGNFWRFASAASGIVNTTTAVTILAAQGAGVVGYITWIDVMSEALTTATELVIRDGAGGTVMWRTKIGTGGLTSGRFIRLDPPLKSTANTLIEVATLTASGAGAVYFNAGGFLAA